MTVAVLVVAAVVTFVGTGEERRTLRAPSLSVVIPGGWFARVRAEPNASAVVEASTQGLPPGDVFATAPRLRPRDVLVQLAEVGNRPGSRGFTTLRRPPRLAAGQARRDRRFGGRPATVVRFAVGGRSFVVIAVFGADPPPAAVLWATNALLSSMRVRPAGIGPAMRARLRRPLRGPPPGACRPAPPARLRTGIAGPVGRAPAYVALGSPGRATAALRDDRRRGTSYLHKTLWAFSPAYRGPLLIRGVSRAGRIRVGDGRLLEWWLPASPKPGWRRVPSTTALPGPGCFAFQVDGTTFSRTIVFRATP